MRLGTFAPGREQAMMEIGDGGGFACWLSWILRDWMVGKYCLSKFQAGGGTTNGFVYLSVVLGGHWLKSDVQTQYDVMRCDTINFQAKRLRNAQHGRCVNGGAFHASRPLPRLRKNDCQYTQDEANNTSGYERWGYEGEAIKRYYSRGFRYTEVKSAWSCVR